MDDTAALQRMIDELRIQRERNCDPKTNENARYHRYSLAVSSLTWLINDLRADT
jgi:hypothetical protein